MPFATGLGHLAPGLCLALVCAPSSGCAVAIAEGAPAQVPDTALTVSAGAAARCVHGVPGPNSPYREALAGPVTDPALLPFLAALDAPTRRTAQAAGLEPLIAETLRARAQSPDAPSLPYLALRQQLAEQVAHLETQLIATEMEVDCVRALFHDALDLYAEGETDRQLAYTIASLVVGSLTGVGSAVWDLANSRANSPAFEDGPLVVSISGAVLTGALGAAVLFPRERPIVFVHRRNLLSPLMFDEDPDFLFPTFVFRLLTLPGVDTTQSPRDELLADWAHMIEAEIDPAEVTTAAAIIYGPGGTYDPELMALHQRLLQRLGGTLDMLSRDLDVFNRSISRALAQ